MGVFGDMERNKIGLCSREAFELRFEELVRVKSPDGRDGQVRGGEIA